MEYRDLIQKFFAKEISDEELIILKAWLSSHPENLKVFDKENELRLLSGICTDQDHHLIESAWNNVASAAGISDSYHAAGTYVNRTHYRFLIAAASIACLLTVGTSVLWFTEKASAGKTAQACTKVETYKKERSHIFLPDSTMVILNSESTLEYPASYNAKERVVKLTGEAYFDVRKNARKPFVVQLNHLSVSATGTRFNVLSYNDMNRIEATLEDGTIFVSVHNNEKPVELKAGQQAIYSRRSKQLEVREVATETYTSWMENKLRFCDTPFEEVMIKIARQYNVNIEITSKALLDLRYTATFIDESIEEVMEMLKDVSPINYRIYYRTDVNSKKYTNPKIVIGMKRKPTR